MPQLTLEVGREYTDEEVRALPSDRQPRPVEPFGYNHPAPGRGQGLKRWSTRRDRWCPFCQTPLDVSQRACDTCGPIRRGTVRETVQPQSDEDTEAEDLAVQAVLDAVDQMSQVIALASGHKNRRGQIPASLQEDMFMTCKDVIIAADNLKRR